MSVEANKEATDRQRPDHHPARQSERFVEWLAIAAVGLAAFTLAAPYAPARMKLLGLFAVVCGLLAGWGVGTLARVLDVGRNRGSVTIAVVLIVGGQAGLALQSWRLYAAQLEATYQAEVDLPLALPQGDGDGGASFDLEGTFRAGDELRSSLREERRRELAEKAGFPSFLKHRVSPLGDWASPWPEVFFGIELLLAAAVGTWVFRRTSRSSGESLNSADSGR